ncbi:MAG: tetratricopeptide repeat protein, partial [Planctomycetota bacterium]|nr:tetratricopeptide repeat protein [Planctomycetota bacterium]
MQLLRDSLNDERDEELRQEVLDVALEDARQLIAELRSNPSPERLLALEAELRFMVTANVIPPSEIQALIRPLVADGLLPLDMNLMMAQVYVLSDPDFSKLTAEAVLDEGPLTVGLFSTIQPKARSEAALILFDTEFGRLSAEAGELDGLDIDTSNLNAYRELVLDAYVGDPRLPIIDLYTRGSINLLEGKTELARANFMEIKDDELFQQRGMFERFIPRLVSAATLSGERGVAVDVLREFLESVPIEMAGSLRLTYAQELLRLGQAQEAARQVDAVLATNPTDERALQLKQQVTSAASAVGSFVRTTQDADQRLLQRAQSSLRDGNLEDARTLLESIIKDNDDIAFKRLLVSVNAQLGFVDEINQMIAANPELSDDPYIARILSLLEISDPIELIMVTSESTYETDSEINANRLFALLRLALTNSDASDRARALLEETFALVAADPPLDSTLRASLIRNALRYDIRSGLLNTPEAYGDRIFAAISAVEDSEVSLANMQATLKATIGQPRETLRILQPLVDRNIANDESLLIQALAYRDLGQNDDSIDALQMAYDRSPDNITYIKLLANWL